MSVPGSPRCRSGSREIGPDKRGKRVVPWEGAVPGLTQVPSLRRTKHIAAIRARPALAARGRRGLGDELGAARRNEGEDMKRHAGAFMLLSVLGGCVSSDKMSPGPQPFGLATGSHCSPV